MFIGFAQRIIRKQVYYLNNHIIDIFLFIMLFLGEVYVE